MYMYISNYIYILLLHASKMFGDFRITFFYTMPLALTALVLRKNKMNTTGCGPNRVAVKCGLNNAKNHQFEIGV